MQVYLEMIQHALDILGVMIIRKSTDEIDRFDSTIYMILLESLHTLHLAYSVEIFFWQLLRVVHNDCSCRKGKLFMILVSPSSKPRYLK